MSAVAPSFSCEFFPPSTQKAQETLMQTAQHLAALRPHFYSVTFGAGGSTQDRTLKAVDDLNALHATPIVPHLTCIGSTEQSILSLLESYRSRQIRHIVALRGDLPNGVEHHNQFNYALELIKFIKEKTGDEFFLYVAAYPEAHPQALSPNHDIQVLLDKLSAGANAAITQYFFNTDAYLYLRDTVRQQGFEQPIIPGIMPITNYTQLAKFSAMCGTEIPRWLRLRLEHFADDLVSLKQFGHEVMYTLCQNLIKEGVEHLHFYTLNQVHPTQRLLTDLGI